MKCIHCNKLNEQGAKFCGICGKVLIDESIVPFDPTKIFLYITSSKRQIGPISTESLIERYRNEEICDDDFILDKNEKWQKWEDAKETVIASIPAITMIKTVVESYKTITQLGVATPIIQPATDKKPLTPTGQTLGYTQISPAKQEKAEEGTIECPYCGTVNKFTDIKCAVCGKVTIDENSVPINREHIFLFINSTQQEIGPMNIEELLEKYKNGEVTDIDFILTKDKKWIQLSKVKEVIFSVPVIAKEEILEKPLVSNIGVTGETRSPTLEKEPNGLTKYCPACGEIINKNSIKCRHCGEFFVECRNCGEETIQSIDNCHKCGSSLKFAIAPPEPQEVLYAAQNKPQNEYNYQLVQETGIESATRRALASSKSFVGSAFLALVLYYLGFYITGLIVNLVYLSHANRIKQETNISPSGRGCLIVLLVVHISLLIIGCIGWLLFGAMCRGLWEIFQ